jgi:hypothetical protein
MYLLVFATLYFSSENLSVRGKKSDKTGSEKRENPSRNVRNGKVYYAE